MEDELWMRKIKERLDDYSEPLPVSGWERLEKDLSVSKPPVAGKRRIIPFRRWAVAAAAALLVAVSSVSVWLLQSPVGEEMRNMTAPALAAVPDKLPEQQTPSVRTEITEPDYRAQKQESPADTNRRSLLAQQLNTVDETERETVIQSLGAEPEVQTGNAQEPTAESARVNQEAAEEVPEPQTEPVPETEDTAAPVQPELNFSEDSSILWPVSGQVTIDYSMDTTTYFSTLDQYKCNSALVMSAEVGAPVQAAANGKVVSVLENEETGTTATLDMGNGYQAVYGQLKDVTVEEGQVVESGTVLGYVNEPTKYYVKEGSNLYFAMTKDGTPIDPMIYMETVTE